MKLRLSVLYLLLAALLIGCGTRLNNDDTGDDSMDTVVLTQTEIMLMRSAFPYAEGIAEGELLSHQLTALLQLREGLSYLERKYPGRTFEYTSFSPATKLSTVGKIIFGTEDAPDQTLTITPQDDGYVCADTYYGALVREAYDGSVRACLSGTGLDVLSYTSFTVPLGEETDESVTAEELIRQNPKLTRHTELFMVDTDGREEAMAAIRSALLETGFYGAYTLRFVPVDRFGDVTDLERDRTEFPHLSFNCFDVG